MPDPDRVREKIAAIETEMRRIGFWQSEPPRPEQYDFKAAFAMDTMAYGQWLQFVFIPRVKELLNSGGAWPGSSHVGTQAIRESDGMTETSELVSLLSEFDALFGG
jgi:uncharacterized protein YqcC (DUF446 family)